MINLHI